MIWCRIVWNGPSPNATPGAATAPNPRLCCGAAPLQAWLFRILVNRHRDLLRSVPATGHLIPVEDLPHEPATIGNQEQHLALREVSAAMHRLPPDQREALLMVAIGGKTFDQAADILDIPKGTLMSRIARARATLRTLTGRIDTQKPKTGQASP
jgi:RNA polymerase sigma-70 factor, ECF subfamily